MTTVLTAPTARAVELDRRHFLGGVAAAAVASRVSFAPVDDARDFAYRVEKWRRNGSAPMRIMGVAPEAQASAAIQLTEVERDLAARLRLPVEHVWARMDARFSSGASIFSHPILRPTDGVGYVRERFEFIPELEDALDEATARVTPWGSRADFSVRYARQPQKEISATERREMYWRYHPTLIASVPRANRDYNRYPELAREVVDFERGLAQSLGLADEVIFEAASFWLSPARAHAWTWVRRFPELPRALERVYFDGLARISPALGALLESERHLLNRGDAARLGLRHTAPLTEWRAEPAVGDQALGHVGVELWSRIVSVVRASRALAAASAPCTSLLAAPEPTLALPAPSVPLDLNPVTAPPENGASKVLVPAGSLDLSAGG